MISPNSSFKPKPHRGGVSLQAFGYFAARLNSGVRTLKEDHCHV
ncbi:hypothetical protein CFBP498_03390 [Xanthomonas hortorum pv. vitians]|uniref:Uncharacterized protein n=1 Tax=Xanthomonas hortorum pv. vitians TaxID=83224 RepID=A0A6V7BJT4_9XANT|nr:hypothetical protein CFBP498_03390 [Xanthomonas hortorum pv. vitians]CAD0302107.1 hypothetical protein CFBP498_03390 [Xanthomonas hortorum pv. vitians]